MATRRDNRTRVLVATLAVASGLALGVLVIGLAGGAKQPAVYQPFQAGLEVRLTQAVKADGPIFHPDPEGGTRAFYLDLEGGRFVALRVVAPGAGPDCLVQWDRETKHYANCRHEPIDPATLRRFPVFTRPFQGKTAVYVDLRRLEPAPGQEQPPTS